MDWYRRNKQRLNKQQAIYERGVKQAALDAYGQSCACCGESRHEFLALDHIDGRKRGHAIDSLRGVRLYRWLRRQKYPKTLHLRVLCHNCNNAISAYKTCPHQLPKPETVLQKPGSDPDATLLQLPTQKTDEPQSDVEATPTP